MSIMVGIGRGAQLGILIRDAEALESMRQIDTVVVDKTGTLTQGKPTVQALSPTAGFDAAELLRLAASVQTASEHPLARAIGAPARLRNLKLDAARDFGPDPGLGASSEAPPYEL